MSELYRHTAGSDHLAVKGEGLCKRYGRLSVLDDVSFQVEQGEFLTLLGPSGSGKTTLLMVLAGFVQPDSGCLYLGRRQVIGTPAYDRNLGMVFQNYALFPHMSVLQNVMFPLGVRGIKGNDAKRKAEGALDLVGLASYGSRKINELSGGQQQRVALARAIVFEPPILLMDEPLSALDKNLREQMQLELRGLHTRLKMTIISVTHDQREALTMSDRIAVMRSGKIEQISTPIDLYQRPNSPFVASFIGESALVPASVSGNKASIDGVELRLAEVEPKLRRGLLLLRPENLTFGGEDQRSPDTNAIPAKITGSVYQGDSFVIFARLSTGQEIPVRLPATAENRMLMPLVGSQANLLLHVNDTLVLEA
ncbi:hypothetical protein ASD00_31385 [Ensifer sp. Root31]|uniref:ABC transporter ATP-binding protein n=1 Tax=Ensifer sp. Root31 TaxID=1736512 RepID=UPI00070DCFC0|nr:ABC transporter ATP-binding protein [Ensifer sp. Root31]KQU86393.1 hypothetical protein ASD00_31385 [Ensifer sp. Root31]